MIHSKERGQDRPILLVPLKMREKWETIIPVVLLCAAAGYSVCNAYGFLIFPDEYTYWSYAAASGGDDWSAVTSLGLYFSYGYSLILFPIYVLFRDAVAAYRVGVGINFILLLISFLCLAKACERMRGDQNLRMTQRIPMIFFAAVSVFYPGHLFSAQMTMTETMILMLYIVSGMLLYRYLEENSVKVLVPLLLLLFYLYIVHMRTVGILLSAFLVLLFHNLSGRGRRQHIVWIMGLMGLLFLGSHFVKEWAYANVFGGLNIAFIKGNDYSGQIEKIQYIFTREGFYDLFVHIVGKVLYLGLASFGLFYWGVYGFLKRLLCGKASSMYADGEKTDAEVGMAQREFSAYILLTAAAQIMIATIYLLTMGEISDYTYGRYSEIILPFIMMEGLQEVWKQRAKIVCVVSGVITLVHGVFVWLVVKQVVNTGVSVFSGYFMAGISYLYHADGFTPGTFYKETYIAGTILMLAVMTLLLWCGSKKRRQWMLTVFLVMQMVLAVRVDHIF